MCGARRGIEPSAAHSPVALERRRNHLARDNIVPDHLQTPPKHWPSRPQTGDVTARVRSKVRHIFVQFLAGTGVVAAADATPPATELIAGKFKSNDELLKAYLELQSKLGAPKDPPATTTPATTVKSSATNGTVTEPPATLSIDPAAAAAKATEQAGLDMQALTAEYAEKGDLSPEAYAKLEAVGISKQMVAD